MNYPTQEEESEWLNEHLGDAYVYDDLCLSKEDWLVIYELLHKERVRLARIGQQRSFNHVELIMREIARYLDNS